METIKQEKPGRGGRRSGAGRPGLGRDQEAFRAVTKSITLTREEWDLLAKVAPLLSPSRGLSAALEIALDARCRPSGWVGGVLTREECDLLAEEWDLLAKVAPLLSPSRGLSAALEIALDARCRPLG